MRNLNVSELDMVLGGSINGQYDPYSLDGDTAEQVINAAAKACGSSGAKSIKVEVTTNNDRKGVGAGRDGVGTKGQNDSSTITAEVDCDSSDSGSGSDSGDDSGEDSPNG